MKLSITGDRRDRLTQTIVVDLRFPGCPRRWMLQVIYPFLNRSPDVVTRLLKTMSLHIRPRTPCIQKLTITRNLSNGVPMCTEPVCSCNFMQRLLVPPYQNLDLWLAFGVFVVQSASRVLVSPYHNFLNKACSPLVAESIRRPHAFLSRTRSHSLNPVAGSVEDAALDLESVSSLDCLSRVRLVAQKTSGTGVTFETSGTMDNWSGPKRTGSNSDWLPGTLLLAVLWEYTDIDPGFGIDCPRG